MTKQEPPSVEARVKAHYDEAGWIRGDGTHAEDKSFRVFRPAYADYHAKVEARTLQAFGDRRGRILFVGCGDFPPGHQQVAAMFGDLVALDISTAALTATAEVVDGPIGLINGSAVSMPIADNAVDAVFCAHVLYHIDISQQEAAVSEMLRVTRPGGRVIILYANSKSPFAFAARAVRKLRRLGGRVSASVAPPEDGTSPLYFALQPPGWWDRFSGVADVSLTPWDIVGSQEERNLIFSDRLADRFYRWAGRVEREKPARATRLWQFTIVRLEKRVGPADQ